MLVTSLSFPRVIKLEVKILDLHRQRALQLDRLSDKFKSAKPAHIVLKNESICRIV